MRISRWAAVPLLILTLVLGACSGGGDDAGGGSEASDGAKAAEEALADQEREAAEVLDQAKSDLDAAVQGLQACNPDVEQLRRVAQPLGVLQQFGADTDAITPRQPGPSRASRRRPSWPSRAPPDWIRSRMAG